MLHQLEETCTKDHDLILLHNVKLLHDKKNIQVIAHLYDQVNMSVIFCINCQLYLNIELSSLF